MIVVMESGGGGKSGGGGGGGVDYRTTEKNRVEYWVAVKELKLSYYIGETLLFTIHTQYGNLI